ncbi:MAG: hypothetical protein NTV68_01140, partial [Methanomicrobiales archaeon]|nr:hypothetical protein [Methanomicrobiales archaeon]
RIGKRGGDMIKRFSQRRKLLIGGCIFAAVVIGVACTGITPAQAASCEVSMQASGDQMLSSSSDWTWTASDGDLSKTPPLGIGQEILQGGYSGSVLVSGPGTYSNDRSLSTDDILEFSTGQQVDNQGLGILTESLMVYSYGSPSAGVTCGADSFDADGTNLTRQAYCEYAGASTMFITDALNYHSAGGISQGDTELPDSLAMDVSSLGNGYGSFAAGSRSLIGIGNTSALGYVHTTSERVGAAGVFTMNGKVRWISFIGG